MSHILLLTIQRWAIRWALGCVNSGSWLPLATGRKFTQPRAHLISQLYIFRNECSFSMALNEFPRLGTSCPYSSWWGCPSGAPSLSFSGKVIVVANDYRDPANIYVTFWNLYALSGCLCHEYVHPINHRLGSIRKITSIFSQSHSVFPHENSTRVSPLATVYVRVRYCTLYQKMQDIPTEVSPETRVQERGRGKWSKKWGKSGTLPLSRCAINQKYVMRQQG